MNGTKSKEKMGNLGPTCAMAPTCTGKGDWKCARCCTMLCARCVLDCCVAGDLKDEQEPIVSKCPICGDYQIVEYVAVLESHADSPLKKWLRMAQLVHFRPGRICTCPVCDLPGGGRRDLTVLPCQHGLLTMCDSCPVVRSARPVPMALGTGWLHASSTLHGGWPS